jgi:hypothetical protein
MTRMHSSPEFDPRIADWLEEDPDHAPPAVLDTVLAAYPSIPQRRAWGVPRRLPTMNRLALIGAAIATLVAVGLGGLVLTSVFTKTDVGVTPSQTVASPSPSPAANSTSTVLELNPHFTSTRNGYTFRYPEGWAATPASAAWLHGTETLWGDPALDVVQSADARFVAASQALAPGETPEEWYIAYCERPARNQGCADYARKWTPVMIGGESGYVDIDGDPALSPSLKPGAPMYDAVVVHNGRGYKFTLDGNADRNLFERMLATVTFRLASASAIDHVTDTYVSPLYGYTIGVDPKWPVTAATVPIDNPASTDATAFDDIKVLETDTTIQVAAHELGALSYEAFLANTKADVDQNPTVTGSCKPGDPSTWTAVPVGTDHTGRVMVLCNFEQVFVHVGNRVYEFTWGHETFDANQHLAFSDFEQVLKTVIFPTAPSPLP